MSKDGYILNENAISYITNGCSEYILRQYKLLTFFFHIQKQQSIKQIKALQNVLH